MIIHDEVIYWIEQVSEMKTMDHMRDQMLRTETFDAIQNVFNDYDLIVTPTLACLPVDNADDRETKGLTQINGQAVDPLIGFCLTFFTNFTGHPAASVPAGLVDNLPVGMQIIDKRLADADVITASSVFEQLKPWQDMYQICENRNVSMVNSNS